ncbi:glycosyltransferase family 39 protein [Candidatus Collierbacteria bacterium]|nr:glycosyltransferase family 39 protein [Candidatus Collierbacteria bacterium]
MKRWPIFFLLTILFFLHFYRLGDIPPGLNNDEANIGYEAWSIATTGRDQWGNFLPLVFQGFGNWSLPVYIYLTAPFVRILGPTILAVRAVSALSFLALVLLVYAIVKKFRPQIAFPAAVMTAVTPWIYGLTRIATEVPLAMAFFLAAIYFFLESRKHRQWVIASAAFLMLSIFTYYGMWVLAGLFFVFLGFLNRNRAWGKKYLMVLLIMSAVCAFLIIKISLIQGGNARLNQVNITNDVALVGQLNAERGACNAKFSGLTCKFFFNKPVLFIKEFTANYLSHFSIREWFILGSNKGILPPGGHFLMVQAPLLILGLWVLLVKGTEAEKMILLPWLALSPLADSLTGPGNFARAFALAPVVSIIASYSFLAIPKKTSLATWGIIGLSWIGFQLVYHSYFPVFHSLYTHYEYQPLMQELNGEKLPIYLSSRFRDTKQYIFYSFYNRIPPINFQQRLNVVKEVDSDGWVWVKRIGNWNFVKSLPQVKELPERSILAGAAKEEIEPFINKYQYCSGITLGDPKIIYFLNGNPAFSILPITKKTEEITCQN